MVNSFSLIFQRFTPLCWKDIGIRIIGFVFIAQLLLFLLAIANHIVHTFSFILPFLLTWSWQQKMSLLNFPLFYYILSIFLKMMWIYLVCHKINTSPPPSPFSIVKYFVNYLDTRSSMYNNILLSENNLPCSPAPSIRLHIPAESIRLFSSNYLGKNSLQIWKNHIDKCFVWLFQFG